MNATGHLPIEILSAHLDGETTPGERASVEAHLAGCASCRATLEDLRTIADASAQLAIPGIPEGLRARVIASIGRPAPARRAWIGAAASIAAVGLVATAWYLQGPEAPVPKPPPAPAPVLAPAPSERNREQPRVPGEAEGTVAPAASRAKKQEAKLDAVDVPDRRDESSNRVPASFPRDEQREADSAFARDAAPGVFREQSRAVAPSASVAIDEELAKALGFVEVQADAAVDRAALFEALGAIGVSPGAATDERAIELLVPRARWSECREVLTRFKIRVDDTEVPVSTGEVIGIRIRTPAP